jgi:hypothetical protein
MILSLKYILSKLNLTVFGTQFYHVAAAFKRFFFSEIYLLENMESNHINNIYVFFMC